MRGVEPRDEGPGVSCHSFRSDEYRLDRSGGEGTSFSSPPDLERLARLASAGGALCSGSGVELGRSGGSIAAAIARPQHYVVI